MRPRLRYSRHYGDFTNQREAIFAAAETVLDDVDRELLSAILDVHRSIETERTALAHGHFGTFDKVSDIILWMKSTTYVELKAKLNLANVVFTEEMKDKLFRNISYYNNDDLEKIQNDIEYCANLWVETINWARSYGEQRGRLYRQLCDQPRIAQALAILRQKNIPPTPPQLPPPVGGGTG